MDRLTLTGRRFDAPDPNRIFCPSLAGLSATQADLAFVMPRLDHNRMLRETPQQGDWAALLASDPFGSEAALLATLLRRGYRGLTNWPSSILLDGALRQSMSTIPATPEFEYERLARARGYGFEVMAFFLSLDQGRAAIKAGLDHLILHPGLLEVDNADGRALVQGSLQKIIDELRKGTKGLRISIYSSPWHEASLKLGDLDADGVIWFEAQNGP